MNLLEQTLSKIVTDAQLLVIYANCGDDAVKTSEAVGLSVSQVRKRLRRIRLAGSSDRPTLLEKSPTSSPPNEQNRLQGLLDRAAVDSEAIGKIKSVQLKEWGVSIKNAEGKFEEHGLYGSTINIVPDSPDFPLIQPATPTTIVYNEAPRILRKVKHIVILSDMQMGYLRDIESGLLEPTHDPRAMEVARQIIADTQPTKVVGIGDRLDWPVFSRWVKRPEFFGVTQPSIQAGYEWAGRFIAAAPANCVHIEIPSNHQMRPETFILEYNREALGLTRAKRPGDKTEWPVFSEQFLLRYDELGIKFSGAYPGGEQYLFPDLMVMHAPPKVHEFRASVLHGHTHKLSMDTTVTHGFGGRHSYLMIDTGCLCAVDTTTNTRRLLVTKVPSDRGRTNWAQGIAVIEYIEGRLSESQWQAHLVRINDGTALFQGQSYYVQPTFNEGISGI